MTWLAKIALTKDEIAENALLDTYAWHKATWQCFPYMDGQRPYLMRLMGGVCYLLSRVKPVRPSWCPEAEWQIKEVAPSFLDHDLYRFDLMANPTKRICRDPWGKEYSRHPRVPLTREDAQRVWLMGKAGKHGFSIKYLEVDHGKNIFCKNEIGCHVGVRFRGVLKVEDRDLFEDAFHKGIGSAKAFGFGMLLLEPIR